MANPFNRPCSKATIENPGYYQNLNIYQLYQLEILVDKIEICHGKLKNCGSFDDSETDDDDLAGKNVTFNKSTKGSSASRKKKGKKEEKTKVKKEKSGDEKEKHEKPKKEKKAGPTNTPKKSKKKKGKKKDGKKGTNQECTCFPIDPWGPQIPIHSKAEFEKKPESTPEKSAPESEATDTEMKRQKKKKKGKGKEETVTDVSTAEATTEEEEEEKTEAETTDAEEKPEKAKTGKKGKRVETSGDEGGTDDEKPKKGKEKSNKSAEKLKKKDKGGTTTEESTDSEKKKRKGDTTSGSETGGKKKDHKSKSKSTLSAASSRDSKKSKKKKRDGASANMGKPVSRWRRWRPPLKYPLPPLKVSVSALHLKKISINQVDLEKLYPTLEDIPESEEEYHHGFKKLTSKVSGKSSKSRTSSKGGSRGASNKGSGSSRGSQRGSSKGQKKSDKGVDAKKLHAALQSLQNKQDGVPPLQSCGDAPHFLHPDDKDVVTTERKKAEKAARAALREKRMREQARRDEAIYRLTRCTHFNRGLSCVFASTPLNVITSMLKSTFSIQIERSDIHGPAYYIGKASIILPPIYIDMVQRAAGCETSTLPLWACTDDIFPVVSDRGKEVGTIWAYVCLTCLGRAVTTQHLATQTGLYTFTNISRSLPTNPLKCSTVANPCDAFKN